MPDPLFTECAEMMAKLTEQAERGWPEDFPYRAERLVMRGAIAEQWKRRAYGGPPPDYRNTFNAEEVTEGMMRGEIALTLFDAKTRATQSPMNSGLARTVALLTFMDEQHQVQPGLHLTSKFLFLWRCNDQLRAAAQANRKDAA